MALHHMAMTSTAMTSDAFEHALLARCPACGDIPIAPLATNFVGKGHIRSAWSCDSCSYAFVTSIEFEPTDDD